ncbi:MAG: hypothetical protein LUG61_06555 [Lachnospiraceae bacterium]|nr:hypothetical protein [Lachnospiraceae bacterium]
MKKHRVSHRLLVLALAFTLSAALIGCGRNNAGASDDGYVENNTTEGRLFRRK